VEQPALSRVLKCDYATGLLLSHMACAQAKLDQVTTTQKITKN